MSDELYIVVRNWERFQNADVWKKSGGRPPWLKLYHRLLDDDAWLDLTPARRSLLVGIWMLYARSGRALLHDTARISRALGQRVLSRDLEALNRAGFIDVLSREALERLATRGEGDVEKTSLQGSVVDEDGSNNSNGSGAPDHFTEEQLQELERGNVFDQQLAKSVRQQRQAVAT